MNASALLTSLGWSGPSTPLNPTSATASTHITKPLLISQKKNTLGVGNGSASDRWGKEGQWWLKNFDEALRNIGTGATKKAEQGGEGKKDGLERFFVSGGLLEGTIREKQATGVGRERTGKKRKRRDEVEMAMVSMEGSRERKEKEKRKFRREIPTPDKSQKEGILAVEKIIRRSEEADEKQWNEITDEKWKRESPPSREISLMPLLSGKGDETVEMARRERRRKLRRVPELEMELQGLKDAGPGDDEKATEEAIKRLEKKIRRKRVRWGFDG